MINECRKINMNADEYDTPLTCCFNVNRGDDFEVEVIGNVHQNAELLK
jgi:hypothetical protein